MRQIRIFLLFFSLLIFYSCTGHAQKEPLKMSNLKFESIFGTTDKEPNSIYSLLGKGFFRTPRSDNSDSLITEWINKHPNAIVVPISSFGPIADDPKSKMIYCWVIDNNDTLNNYLIKNGCFPGGTMIRPETWKEMKKWEKELYESVDEKPDIKVYVSNKTYNTFIEQIKTAELYARENKLGIWIDDTDE